MLAWAYGLVSASERGGVPSFWLLPLMALWANLHGGFVLGLALVAPIALDAVLNAEIVSIALSPIGLTTTQLASR